MVILYLHFGFSGYSHWAYMVTLQHCNHTGKFDIDEVYCCFEIKQQYLFFFFEMGKKKNSSTLTVSFDIFSEAIYLLMWQLPYIFHVMHIYVALAYSMDRSCYC